jgi:hypothetical protein
MKKDDYITEVIFRKWNRKAFKNDIVALFPYEIEDFSGNCMGYERVGQHGGANYTYCISASVPAKAEEYNSLKIELESLGYNLKVINKRNYDKYLTELNKINKQ